MLLDYVLSATVASFLLSVTFAGLLGVTITNEDITLLKDGNPPKGFLPFLFANLSVWFRLLFFVGTATTLAILTKKGIDLFL